jgi:hypothetical protein
MQPSQDPFIRKAALVGVAQFVEIVPNAVRVEVDSVLPALIPEVLQASRLGVALQRVAENSFGSCSSSETSTSIALGSALGLYRVMYHLHTRLRW